MIANDWAPADEQRLLNVILFSAKTDYLKIATPGHRALPQLDGTPRWSRKEHFRSLTVHDASPEDVTRLQDVFGNVPILELEIAIDARPRPSASLTEAERTKALNDVMVNVYARGLIPHANTGINKSFRAYFRLAGARRLVQPYNKRLPKATDQQLHGGRQDCCQVKAYLKRADMGAELSSANHVARVEVRLAKGCLLRLQLANLTDLSAFRFRKFLMPFFTHASHARAKSKLKGRWGEGVVVSRTSLYRDYWRKAGVGAFADGGFESPDRVRLMRNTRVNNRIGQALTRYERSLRNTKSVCSEQSQSHDRGQERLAPEGLTAALMAQAVGHV